MAENAMVAVLEVTASSLSLALDRGSSGLRMHLLLAIQVGHEWQESEMSDAAILKLPTNSNRMMAMGGDVRCIGEWWFEGGGFVSLVVGGNVPTELAIEYIEKQLSLKKAELEKLRMDSAGLKPLIRCGEGGPGREAGLSAESTLITSTTDEP